MLEVSLDGFCRHKIVKGQELFIRDFSIFLYLHLVHDLVDKLLVRLQIHLVKCCLDVAGIEKAGASRVKAVEDAPQFFVLARGELFEFLQANMVVLVLVNSREDAV